VDDVIDAHVAAARHTEQARNTNFEKDTIAQITRPVATLRARWR
jgi:hypothetical protein